MATRVLGNRRLLRKQTPHGFLSFLLLLLASLQGLVHGELNLLFDLLLLPTFLVLTNCCQLDLVKHGRCLRLPDELHLPRLLLRLLLLDVLLRHLFHRLYLQLLLLPAEFLFEQFAVGALEPHLVESLLLVGLFEGLDEEGLETHIQFEILFV